MIGRTSAWHVRRFWWISALSLCAFSFAVFAVYELYLDERVSYLEMRLKRASSARDTAAAEARREQEKLGRLEGSRREVEAVVSGRFGAYDDRLTQVMSEVKELAKKSNLVLHSISYPQEGIEDLDLVAMSFDFTVEGSFDELRTFLNSIELSEFFLIVDNIALNGTEDTTSLKLKIQILTFLRPPKGYAGLKRG